MGDETSGNGAAPATPVAKTAKARKAPQRITDNAALVAINKIERVFAGLDTSTRLRVLNYIGQQVYASMPVPEGTPLTAGHPITENSKALSGSGSVASGRELL